MSTRNSIDIYRMRINYRELQRASEEVLEMGEKIEDIVISTNANHEFKVGEGLFNEHCYKQLRELYLKFFTDLAEHAKMQADQLDARIRHESEHRNPN